MKITKDQYWAYRGLVTHARTVVEELERLDTIVAKILGISKDSDLMDITDAFHSTRDPDDMLKKLGIEVIEDEVVPEQ